MNMHVCFQTSAEQAVNCTAHSQKNMVLSHIGASCFQNGDNDTQQNRQYLYLPVV